MARIAGIQIEKDTKGRPAYARINLKKHPETIVYLNKVGAINQEKEDSDLEIGITGDELMSKLKPRIKKLFDK
jgi:hypothetical protein